MAEPITATTRVPHRRSAHSEVNDMSLPAGRTCGDCIHLNRCAALFGAIAADEVCDFAPSRFQQREQSTRERSLEAVAVELTAALIKIEAHHVALNERRGRPLDHSTTLRITRDALAAARAIGIAPPTEAGGGVGHG